jgi:hypothetical protein
MDAIASIRSLKFTRNADAAADTCTDSRFDARTGGVASVARRVPPSSRARALRRRGLRVDALSLAMV